MTKSEFVRIGYALFPGPGWEARLAECLGVPDIQVKEWSRGKIIPDHIECWLIDVYNDSRTN